MQTSREGRRPARDPRPARRGVTWRRLDPVTIGDWAQTLKTALAGVLAWVVATDVLGLEQAFLAPWAAVLVVHATVFRTVSRGGQQVVATFLGVVLAWAAGTLFGLGPLGMGAMLLASLVVGRLRWLSEESMTIATTGIVVLATNAIDSTSLLGSRLLDTTVGIVVGLSVNLLVWPPLRDRVAWDHAHRLRHQVAGLLEQMASALGPDLDSSEVEAWIGRCREIDEEIDRGWGLLRQARESSRFNPRRSRPADLDPTGDALRLMEEAVAGAMSLARTVATSADLAHVWDDDFRSQWQSLLAATARGLEDADVAALERVRTDLGPVLEGLSTEALPRSVWQEYGGLLVTLRNLVEVAVALARWAAEASSTPLRTRRFDVRPGPAAGSRGRVER